MTTIAWDGKSIAADSWTIDGTVIIQINVNKIYTLVGGYKYIGVAGDAQYARSFIKWLDAGANLETQPFGDYCAIIITNEGLSFDINMSRDYGFEHKYYYELDECVAIGSGRGFAQSAMDFGKSAKEAVEYAITKDIYSGGEVQEYSI